MTNIAVEPQCWRRPHLVEAVEATGATVTGADQAGAVVWADPSEPGALADLLDAHPHLDWVQLPYAGVEPYLPLIDDRRRWTCGKGIYAAPVAEMALAMLLTGLRGLATYTRVDTWSDPIGRELRGAAIAIVGGGGICTELIDLLAPFGCDITVVRNRPDPVPGATHTVGTTGLHDALAHADGVVLALALTPATTGIIGAAELAAMPDHAWLVNVARGAHVVTDDLVDALANGVIGGACLDVTDPEPLPDGHPLWALPNCVITPHVGNTPEMGVRLLGERVTDNVGRYLRGEELLGPVHRDLGY